MGDRVRLVCFDLGGVIIRICQTWAERCAAAGLAIRNPELWDEIKPLRDELMVQYQTGRIEGSHFAQQLSEALRGLYSPAEIMAIHDAWLIDEYEGVGAIVDRLHQAGLDTAALTNITHEHWVRMPQFPTVGRLHHRLASHELRLHKPDPAIYLRLEHQLGYAGREILFFDDTEENVQAAQTVGWRAERIDPARDTARQMAEAMAEHGVAV